MTLRWGIVGLGNMGRRMAHAIQETDDAMVAAVCSRDAAKARSVAATMPGAATYTSYDKMLSDDSIDAIYIATPNVYHCEQTILAVEGGKHVLVEKPMALSVADAERMVAAAEQSRRQLGVGFHLRFHPVHVEMQNLIRTGDLGDVILAQAIWGSYRPDRPRDSWQMKPELAGAGSVYGLGVHLIDLLCWLIDLDLVEVVAMNDEADPQYPVEFLTAGLLRFRGNAFGEFTCSRRLPNGANSVTVYTTGARLEGRATISMKPDGNLAITRGDDTVVSQLTLRDLYALEIEAFGRAVQQEQKFTPSGDDGLRSVKVSLATLEAARTGHGYRFLI